MAVALAIAPLAARAASTQTSNSSAPNPSSYLQNVTFTATVRDLGGGPPTGTVQFFDGASFLGQGAVSAANVVSDIRSGESHSCIVTPAGGVKCWGWNSFGELGNGSTFDSNVPVDVVGLASGVSAVAPAYDSTCALTVTGGVKCWGRNFQGILGNGTATDSATPVDVVGLDSGVAAIATGTRHTCAVLFSGSVKCWGMNFAGQLGNASTNGSMVPVSVFSITDAVAVIAGNDFSCALRSGGGVKCWGGNSVGQLGDGTNTDRTIPVDVVGLSGVLAISSGENTNHACALLNTSAVKCWGYNASGQLGDGTTTDSNVPLVVPGLSTTNIRAKAELSCTVISGGVKCWGNSVTAPADVAGFTSGVTDFSIGSTFHCATFGQIAVKCEGNNGAGQLGDGSNTNRGSPVYVTQLSKGTASYSIATLGMGFHFVTANYLGDGNHDSSTSSAVTQQVLQPASTTSLGSSQNPSVFGQSVRFTATVSGPGGTPSGTVTFKDGATTLGTGTLSGGGAIFDTADLSVGDHSITAVYGGDIFYTGSTSSVVTQTVDKGATTIGLGSSANPSAAGQSVTFTATVAAAAPAAGTPGGIVTFLDGASPIGSSPLSGGVAAFSTSSLSAGSHGITAAYGADANFAAATSSVLTQTVNSGFVVSVSAAPAAGGSVSGGGVYAPGSTPTVTASANGGYSFVNWTENGAVVSSSASYNFTVAGNRTLVANFARGGTYVSARSGTDAGSCSRTAPCATLNYALSVIGAGGTVTILDGDNFGPIMLTQSVTISGAGDAGISIVANPAAQVGCVGALPAACGLPNSGYAVEVAIGNNDTATLDHLTLEAGASGAGALYISAGGTISASHNVYRGNDTAITPIVYIIPCDTLTTLIYISDGEIAFNKNGGAVLVAPMENNTARLHFNHMQVHHALFGIKTDASALFSGSAVKTFVSDTEFFSFTGSAVTALSVAGHGTVNSVYNAVNILNTGGPAVNANGPNSVVVLTNGTLGGNSQGVKVSNGATVLTSQNNTIKGNGTDVSGTMTPSPLR